MFPVPKDIVEKLITIYSETPTPCCDNCEKHNLTNITKCVECGRVHYTCDSCTGYFVKDCLCPCCEGYWCRVCREQLKNDIEDEFKTGIRCDIFIKHSETNCDRCWGDAMYCHKCSELLRGCQYCGVILKLCRKTNINHFVNIENYEDWLIRHEKACQHKQEYRLTLKKTKMMTKIEN